MQFTNAGALLVLGLIPILILIHSLRPKPRDVEVASLFLWREVLRERGADMRIQRFLNNLPLMLQILAVIMAALALARPVWFYPSRIKGDVILVMDTSASMKAITDTGKRFDQAKIEGINIIDQLPKDSKMIIIEAGSNPLIKSGPSSDRDELRRVVKAMKPTDCPGQLEKATYLALSFTEPGRNDLVYLVTDGCGAGFQDLSRLHQKIRPVLVTGGERNVGITKLEFRQKLKSDNSYEIMVEVMNFNSNPVLCPIHLTLDDNTIARETFGLKSGEKKLLIFSYSGPLTGIGKVTLDLKDDFPVDNVAYAVLSESRDIWVMLVSEENYFLRKLLETYPNFRVNSVKQIVRSSWEEQAERHDIVILDRINPPSTERGNFLLIDSFSPSIPLAKDGEIENPKILDWDRREPLLSGVRLDNLYIERADRVKPDTVLSPLVESDQTGLMYAYEKNGLRAVFLGFDLAGTDLPLKVAFPVMMSNIFQWLHPDNLSFSSYQAKTGSPFTIFPEPQTREISILTPSDRWERFQVRSSPFIFSGTDEVGVYSVAEGDRRKYFAVNLLSESESDIRIPKYRPTDQGNVTNLDSESVSTALPLWIIFLSSASLILMLEWYFWLKGR